MDKAARVGNFVSRIFWIKTFSVKRLERNLAEKNRLFEKLYDSKAISFDDILKNITNMVNKSRNM